MKAKEQLRFLTLKADGVADWGRLQTARDAVEVCNRR